MTIWQIIAGVLTLVYLADVIIKGIGAPLDGRLDDLELKLHRKLDALDSKLTAIEGRLDSLESEIRPKYSPSPFRDSPYSDD